MGADREFALESPRRRDQDDIHDRPVDEALRRTRSLSNEALTRIVDGFG